MKKILSIFAVSVVLSLLLLQVIVPVSVFAQVIDGPGQASGQGIRNPLNVNSIQDLIGAALTFVVNLLAIAGAIYIIWAGFMFVKAQGNPSEIEKAKKAFFNAIIGMAIILGAWGISMIIANTINRITNNNPQTLTQP